MSKMQDVWEDLKHQDLEKYKETMEYCKTRVTADEGIPAILGLDDLTAPWDAVWQGSKSEEEFHGAMAAAAMIFASLYEKLEPEELGHYPGIAPAMSALAEMFFRPGADGEAVPYRDAVKDFLKPEQKAGEGAACREEGKDLLKQEQKGGK